MPRKRRSNLRQDLIVAAEKRIREGGVGALSLRKLAQDAGVTTMATYHHFANKKALLVQIAVNGFNDLSARMEAATANCDSTVEAVTEIMRAYFRFALDNLHVYHLMFGQEIEAKASIPEYKEASQHAFYLMANTIGNHQEKNGKTIDPDNVGITFWAVLHGLVCLVSDGTILYRSRSEEKIDMLIDRAVKGLFFDV